MKNAETMGMRKQLLAITCPAYSDLNDGLARTYLSRNKNRNARIHKIGKPCRIKTGHKAIINWIY